MQITFAKSDLENPVARAALVTLIDAARHGGFIRIHGFEPVTGHGEVQTTTYCKGISYPHAIANSLEKLAEIRNNPEFSITVTRGVWKDANGNISPTGRKSKQFGIPGHVTVTYKQGDEVLAAALDKIEKSLTNPKPATKEYNSLGNGIYEDEKGTLYVRDLRVVDKTVIVHGNYPHKASAEVNALADAIKREMPVGKYRIFRLDSVFDSLSIGGAQLVPDTETLDKIEQVKAKVEETEETADPVTV